MTKRPIRSALAISLLIASLTGLSACDGLDRITEASSPQKPKKHPGTRYSCPQGYRLVFIQTDTTSIPSCWKQQEMQENPSNTETTEIDTIPAKTPEITPMRVPSHGRGKLRVGGTNKGGGRTPEKFRIRARQLIKERKLLERLADMAENAEEDRDVRGAIDSLLKVGVPTQREVTTEHVRERLAQTLGVIRELLEPDQAERVIDAIEPIWT